jgi:DNA invertase Pin-like site-specific DNA recombinase
VSTIRQTEGTSIDKQLSWARSQINENRVDLYEEPGRSGESIEGRPKFTELFGKIQSGLYDGATLYAYDQDRLSRSMADWATIAKVFTLHQIRVVTAQGEVDFGKRDQVLISNIKGAVSDWQRSYIMQECQNGKKSVWREGFWPGSRPPLGMRYNHRKTVKTSRGKRRPTIEPIPEYTEAIKQVFEWSRDLRLFEILNRMPSIRGTLLNETQLRRILRQPLYAGHITNPDGQLIKCKQVINPIIDIELFKDISALSESRRTSSVRSRNATINRHTYLLTPILYCGYCGQKYNGVTNPQSRQYKWRGYTCVGKKFGKRICTKSKTHTARILENLVLSDLRDFGINHERLHSNYHQYRLNQDHIPMKAMKVDRELAYLNEQLGNLVKEIARGVLEFGQQFRNRIQREISATEGAIRTLEIRRQELESQNDILSYDELKKYITFACDNCETPEGRKMLYMLVEKVIVYRTKIKILYHYFDNVDLKIPNVQRLKDPKTGRFLPYTPTRQ